MNRFDRMVSLVFEFIRLIDEPIRRFDHPAGAQTSSTFWLMQKFYTKEPWVSSPYCNYNIQAIAAGANP